jgi:glycosyltransferase involved in cell wall biosynthesis
LTNHEAHNEKKVLIITYYWPPSGGSGVQRWLKFVKYLPQFGWQPYVYTPENPSFEVKDETLLNDIPIEAEVIKLPIWEPYSIFSSLSSLMRVKKKSSNRSEPEAKPSSGFQRLATWVRANLFIPDPRIFWIKPSVRFLHDFLKERKITTIITTGPPHSMHLIGLKLKKKNPDLNWVADFRDPWTEWGLWEKFRTGMWAMRRHKKLEQEVLISADHVVSVTPFYVVRFEALSGRKVELLTNGFDEEDFQKLVYVRSKKYTIRHIGIVNEQRDPVPFMKAFHELLQEDEDFRSQVVIEFVGEVYEPFQAYIRARPEVQPYVHFTGNVSHEQVMQYYGSTSLLLLILTGYRDPHGFFPGKLFEYIATGVPVLGIGPVQSDAADVLSQAGTGFMADHEDKEGIKRILRVQYLHWKNNQGQFVKPSGISNYSRKEITSRLVKLLR